MDVKADIAAQTPNKSAESRRDSFNEDIVSWKSRLVKHLNFGEISCREIDESEELIEVKSVILNIFRLPESDVSRPVVFPHFVIPPRDTYIFANQTGTIEANIRCIPKPIVRWYKDNHLITSALFPRIKVPKM